MFEGHWLPPYRAFRDHTNTGRPSTAAPREGEGKKLRSNVSPQPSKIEQPALPRADKRNRRAFGGIQEYEKLSASACGAAW